MHGHMRKGLMVAVLVACGPGSAMAQSTVGEVLDKGGRFLTSAELKVLLTGAKFSGENNSGHPLELNLRADGSIDGMAIFVGKNGRHRNDPVAGTWAVDDKDCYCQTTKNSTGGTDFCRRVLSVGSEYFLVTSDGDRDAKVSRREIKK